MALLWHLLLHNMCVYVRTYFLGGFSMKKTKFLAFGLVGMLSLAGALTALSLNSPKEVEPAHAASEELVAELNTTDIAKMSVGATSYTNSYGTWNFEPSISGIPDDKSQLSLALADTGGSGVGGSVWIDTGRENLTRIEVTANGFKILPGDYQVRLFIWRGKKGGSYGEYAYKFVDNMSTTLTTYSLNFSDITEPSVCKGQVIVNFDRLEKKTTIAGVSNIKIYAAPLCDTVTLDRQGGTGGSTSIEAYPDQAMPSITKPTKTGYTFQGYYTGKNGSGTQYYTAAGASSRSWTKGAASTLYAYWTANSYNVTYNAKQPANATYTVSGVPSGKVGYTYDVEFNLPNPTLTGWTFGGWYKDNACTSANRVGDGGAKVKNIVPSGDTNLYALWNPNNYYVEYDANKPSAATGDVINLPSKAQWTYDNEYTLGSKPSLPGWTFGGWYKDAACTQLLGQASTKVNKANLTTTKGATVKVYAKWTANTYTVVYKGNKPTKAPSSYQVTDLPANQTFTYDASATLGTAPKLAGYEFDGWYKESSCTTKVGNAAQVVSKPNLTTTNEGSANLYAKWRFNDAVQAVVDKINNTKTCSYDDLTDVIGIADEAYDALDPIYQAVVDSEGYKHILENAHAADEVGQMIEDLGPAEDTEAWRDAVEAAREAYEDLEDKSFIPTDPIMIILTDDEAAVVVMDLINDIGDPRWTSTSKNLIDTAQAAYDAYLAAGHPAEQIANHATLVQANTDYDNVQEFVNKVNAITDNPFEYTLECKALIDEARRYFEEDLSEYQQLLATTDASVYYNLLVNYENAWHAMYLIDEIGDMENSEEFHQRIEDARAAVDALDDTSEMPLMNDELLKELTDKEAAWEVIDLINNIYPMVYGEECEKAMEDARNAYEDLTADQKPLVINLDMLVKAEEDYAAVEAVVQEVADLGAIRYDDESLDKIEHARESYENLTDDQKNLYPDFSLEDIVDYETAYVALDKIYHIGDVSYTSESEGLIEEARTFYDNLTDEQKELINPLDYEVLTVSETKYGTLKRNADIFVILMLIFVCLAILGAGFMIFLLIKRRKKKDDDDENNNGSLKKEPVKAMSLGGLSLGIILVSHYLDASYIALYVLAGIAVLSWLAVLTLFLLKKNGKILKAKQAEEEEESVTITDENGNIFQIRYIKSFSAKIIQANEESKKYYEELKNEVLSYKNTNSRISWHYDAINAGREYVVKFAVRGKTLALYLPLNADDYADSKYKVEKVESKKYSDTPCLYRIKNDRRCGYAKELLAVIAEKLGLEKGEEQHEKYVQPYEENKPLIARGLIKEHKVQLNKPVEPEVLEKSVNADGDEIITTKDSSGNIFQIRFIKSFLAKLSQASEEVKNYYNEIKNHALSYKKANSRVSWHYDSINVGKEQVLKFAIRGKTLCVYYALDVEKVDEKYKVEKVESKKYSEVPCLYRIKNDRRCEYAKELIDILMNKLHIEKGEEAKEDYSLPYEETKVLLAKGLIKEVKTKVGNGLFHESISVSEADERMSDEDAESNISDDLGSKKHEGKKGIINIDTIGENFNDGDVVDIEALWEKKLIPSNVGYVKVLARGKLNKKLHLDLQDYSIQAVKMVLLEGGTVKKAK